MHILIIILIWSFAYTSWSVMGRFGLVSLGHGGFLGIGAYVTARAWNYWPGIPGIGAPPALLAGALVAGGVPDPSCWFWGICPFLSPGYLCHPRDRLPLC